MGPISIHLSSLCPFPLSSRYFFCCKSIRRSAYDSYDLFLIADFPRPGIILLKSVEQFFIGADLGAAWLVSSSAIPCSLKKFKYNRQKIPSYPSCSRRSIAVSFAGDFRSKNNTTIPRAQRQVKHTIKCRISAPFQKFLEFNTPPPEIRVQRGYGVMVWYPMLQVVCRLSQ